MKVKSKKNKRKSKDSCTDKRVQFENYFAWNIVIDLCFFLAHLHLLRFTL